MSMKRISCVVACTAAAVLPAELRPRVLRRRRPAEVARPSSTANTWPASTALAPRRPFAVFVQYRRFRRRSCGHAPCGLRCGQEAREDFRYDRSRAAGPGARGIQGRRERPDRSAIRVRGSLRGASEFRRRREQKHRADVWKEPDGRAERRYRDVRIARWPTSRPATTAAWRTCPRPTPWWPTRRRRSFRRRRRRRGRCFSGRAAARSGITPPASFSQPGFKPGFFMRFCPGGRM